MDEQDDVFGKLFDTSSVQDYRELLAETIFPYARIDSETLEVGFTEAGEQLVTREKLLLFLLVRKVLFLQNLIQKEAATPSEVEKGTSIPGGTVRPQLRRLMDEKIIRTEAEGGSYFVPNAKIKDVNKLLTKKGQK